MVELTKTLIEKLGLPTTAESFPDGLSRQNWLNITAYKGLSEEFIERYRNEIDWFSLPIYQKLSDDFIVKHLQEINTFRVFEFQCLSEDFIEKHYKKIYMHTISCYQILSESFIERNSNRLNMEYVSKYQKLSEAFIERNLDEVDMGIIAKYQKLSPEFRAKHNLSVPENNWLYTDAETKRQAILQTGLYEMDGDYVIAYKGVWKDRYSKFNFRHQYLDGGVYEAHADYNLDNENSFGLSASVYEAAKEYCGECVLKVKIHLNDVAALVHNENKLRASKLTVIGEVA